MGTDPNSKTNLGQNIRLGSQTVPAPNNPCLSKERFKAWLFRPLVHSWDFQGVSGATLNVPTLPRSISPKCLHHFLRVQQYIVVVPHATQKWCKLIRGQWASVTSEWYWAWHLMPLGSDLNRLSSDMFLGSGVWFRDCPASKTWTEMDFLSLCSSLVTTNTVNCAQKWINSQSSYVIFSL